MKLCDILNEDSKFDVAFEYQMPGWDESGKTAVSIVNLFAKDKKDAEKQFWKLQKVNKERNALKYALSVENVTPSNEKKPQMDEALEQDNDASDNAQPLHGKDKITVDVPTLIRMLEWAREDVKHDEVIHDFMEALLLNPVKIVNMKHFKKIMSEIKHKK